MPTTINLIASTTLSRLRRPLMAVAALLATTAPAFANTTGGCVDSPENATLVLALLGGSVAAFGWWRRRRNAEHRNL